MNDITNFNKFSKIRTTHFFFYERSTDNVHEDKISVASFYHVYGLFKKKGSND